MRVKLTAQARSELSAIWSQIARTNGEEIADRIVRRILDRTEQLRSFPELGPPRPEIATVARALVVERWLILYSIEPEFIQVVRVLDGRRDLRRVRWPSRA